MRVSVVGKGHVGGGLADLWERAGHQYGEYVLRVGVQFAKEGRW